MIVTIKLTKNDYNGIIDTPYVCFPAQNLI